MYLFPSIKNKVISNHISLGWFSNILLKWDMKTCASYDLPFLLLFRNEFASRQCKNLTNTAEFRLVWVWHSASLFEFLLISAPRKNTKVIFAWFFQMGHSGFAFHAFSTPLSLIFHNCQNSSHYIIALASPGTFPYEP